MSKEATELQRRWVVDTPTRSLRLKLVRRSEVEMTSSWSCSLTAAVGRDVTSMLTTFDVGGQSAVKQNVEFAVRLDQLRRALKANASLTVWNLHASDRDDDVWNSLGLMVGFSEVTSDVRELERIISERGFHVASRLWKRRDGGHWLTSHPAEYVVIDDVTVATPGRAIAAHPCFSQPSNNAVFHSLDEVTHVLTQLQYCDNDPACTELLGHVPESRDVDVDQSESTHPCIVVEGLDASGKTTLVDLLVKKLSACRLRSPPEEIRHLRAAFDSKPVVARRAYYNLGNYLLDRHIRQLTKNQTVVLDRFWHSTSAYGIAEECPEIPASGHDVYRWPGDLTKPSLVVLLVVSEDQRRKRIAGRQLQVTDEETQLAEDDQKRERTLTAYRRMTEPAVLEVSADDSADQVLGRVLELLRHHSILPPVTSSSASSTSTAAPSTAPATE